MDHQQGFVVGVGCGWAPVEGSCDHGFFIDHAELVLEFIAVGEPNNYWLHYCARGVSHHTKTEVFKDFVSA